ncbi:DNA cytosine methyltransferase [Roseovarius sp. C03]|uniref:DNA cytosine methyltransferase n=1 Tax=Roseovarius sp. C03 TaxID=3449222 RepID=UPI003EDB9A26
MSDGVGLRPRRGLSLCAGGGGLDLGLMLAEPGFETACFVEWEPAAQDVLVAAMRAGYFAEAPIWDDVRSFDGCPYRGAIDTLLAGYPCQPFSRAGRRHAERDPRHLWPDIARIAQEIEPVWILLENVEDHVELGLETVLRELRSMGYTVASGLFSAGEVGAPHERKRVFVMGCRTAAAPALADAGGPRLQGAEFGVARGVGPRSRTYGSTPECGRPRLHPPGPAELDAWRALLGSRPDLAPALALDDLLLWARDDPAALEVALETPAQSALCGMADGLAARTLALKMLGNGVHPLAAGYAIRSLGASLGLRPLDLDAGAGRAPG